MQAQTTEAERLHPLFRQSDENNLKRNPILAIFRTDATAEVERCIAIPSQALACKVGTLTILRLKRKAQQDLGARFDPREFHAVVNTGALPLEVLERKINDWIASKRGRDR
jgi:uncharacterized protein (DUF885 family)